ncbi:NAD-dependent epimerase/dehydratase family protein [Agrilutibacter solisilvae]|uniref:Nucleoside-diphosphate sugar epimerase n=1 Tax=Agrilutibacter solisilvae TaxID=2763317 RepID=A0A975ATX3_9GAMM|nr:nucleoside-diphosphate sugar epimerase [Lysobacter solisilvae]QSX79599.1 nucleoside-diphosphate sugar epimerase [Lysobacter solisilvae]
MKHALVFGGSGQIGRPLLGRLLRDGWRVTAVSRQPQHERLGLTWLRGDFDAMPTLPEQVDVLLSCGPLDAFARWYGGSRLECPRVVAFGSTSIEVKRGSADPHERDLAQRLREGEEGVMAAAAARDAAATLLRPTLVYGAGRDATLTRIAHLASQWGRFPLPRRACGLRQPVHVDDLASAAFSAIGSAASHGQAYALPGGETLAYRDMVLRVLETLEPVPTLVELPSPLFNLALAMARLTGRGTGLGEAAVLRMRTHLVFDPAPAQRDLRYAPRGFAPTARMFEARTDEDDAAD